MHEEVRDVRRRCCGGGVAPRPLPNMNADERRCFTLELHVMPTHQVNERRPWNEVVSSKIRRVEVGWLRRDSDFDH